MNILRMNVQLPVLFLALTCAPLSAITFIELTNLVESSPEDAQKALHDLPMPELQALQRLGLLYTTQEEYYSSYCMKADLDGIVHLDLEKLHTLDATHKLLYDVEFARRNKCVDESPMHEAEA